MHMALAAPLLQAIAEEARAVRLHQDCLVDGEGVHIVQYSAQGFTVDCRGIEQAHGLGRGVGNELSVLAIHGFPFGGVVAGFAEFAGSVAYLSCFLSLTFFSRW